jgi:carbonic anhydrase
MQQKQRMKLIVEENVRPQLEHVQEYPFVKRAMQDKEAESPRMGLRHV